LVGIDCETLARIGGGALGRDRGALSSGGTLGPGLDRGALSSGGADACDATARGTDCWREIGGGIAAATTGFVGGCIGAE
jgi:hypothetical protein